MLSRLNLPNNCHVMCRNYSMYYSVNSLVSYEFYYLQDVSCQNLKYLLSFIKYSSFFQMNSTSHSHQLNYPINFYLYPKDQEHLLVIHVLSDQRGFILENEDAFAMISAVVWARRFLCLFYIDRGFSGSKEQCYHLRHPRILLPSCRVHLLVFENCLERCGRKLLFDL